MYLVVILVFLSFPAQSVLLVGLRELYFAVCMCEVMNEWQPKMSVVRCKLTSTYKNCSAHFFRTIALMTINPLNKLAFSEFVVNWLL